MSRSKKTAEPAPASPAGLDWRWWLTSRTGRNLLIALAGVALAVGLFQVAWRRFGPTIIASDVYRLKEEGIVVPPQPVWIHGNIKQDVIRAGALTEISLLDPKLTEKVQAAFTLHTWVADVRRVTKQHPARVIVELEYRRPTAMVEVVRAGERGLLPVDAYGVLLPPDDFSMNQVKLYLRVGVDAAQPEGPVGTPWGDDRVSSAAAIADVLTEHWQKLGLYRIVLAQPVAGPQPGPPAYEIHTKDGFRVLWGHAPGQEQSGEATAAEKIATLLAHYEKNGPLHNGGSERHLNVRGGQPLLTPVSLQR